MQEGSYCECRIVFSAGMASTLDDSHGVRSPGEQDIRRAPLEPKMQAARKEIPETLNYSKRPEGLEEPILFR